MLSESGFEKKNHTDLSTNPNSYSLPELLKTLFVCDIINMKYGVP